MMMNGENRRRGILRQCMGEAGYSVRPGAALEEGAPVTGTRVLTFDFIEDDRFGGSKRALMEKDGRLKKLVNVVREGNIRTLHFSGVDGPSLQWRKTYWVARSGTETWEDVMGKINSIQAPPYKFERIGLPTALSPMHSPAEGVSRAEREKLLKIIESISETLTDEVWSVLHDDYIRLSQAVSDLALENKLGPRRREKITLALNRFANAYHGHYKAPFRPDKAEMTEALEVVKKQVQGLS